MAQATSVLLADAMVSLLNDETWEKGFTAERSYLPEYELTELNILQVAVTFGGFTAEKEDRGGDYLEAHAVLISILQRFDANLPVVRAKMDQMMLLVEEIKDRVMKTPLTVAFEGETEAESLMPDKIENLVAGGLPYNPGHFKELNQFTAVLQATYSLMR